MSEASPEDGDKHDESANGDDAVAGSGTSARVNKFVLLGGIGMLAVIGLAVFGAFSFVESERQREIQQWQIRLGIVADSRAAAVNEWIEQISPMFENWRKMPRSRSTSRQ